MPMSPRAEMFKAIIDGPWDGSNPMGPGICQFTVVFKKLDGSMRTMKCKKRAPRKERVFAGAPNHGSKDPYKNVWDDEAKGWRKVNYETMVYYRVGKKEVY